MTWAVPLALDPPFSKAILPLTKRKSNGTVTTYLVLGVKEECDGAVSPLWYPHPDQQIICWEYVLRGGDGAE